MERITRGMSMCLPVKKSKQCAKCKEYKSCTTNLVSIIQQQNKDLEQLQRQLNFTKQYYQEQLRRIYSAQEHESSTYDSTRETG